MFGLSLFINIFLIAFLELLLLANQWWLSFFSSLITFFPVCQPSIRANGSLTNWKPISLICALTQLGRRYAVNIVQLSQRFGRFSYRFLVGLARAYFTWECCVRLNVQIGNGYTVYWFGFAINLIRGRGRKILLSISEIQLKFSISSWRTCHCFCAYQLSKYSRWQLHE